MVHKDQGNQGGEAPLDPRRVGDLYRLVTDFRHARRQRRHYVLQTDGQVAYGDKNLGRCLQWLTERDQWCCLWVNGSDSRVMTFLRPGSELARTVHKVWTEWAAQTQSAPQATTRDPLTLDDLISEALRPAPARGASD